MNGLRLNVMKKLDNNTLQNFITQIEFLVTFIFSTHQGMTSLLLKMTEINFTNNLNRKAFLKVNKILRIIGLSLNIKHKDWKLSAGWLFYLSFLCIFSNMVNQMLWLVRKSLSGVLLLVDITYVGPCLALCFLGCAKSLFFFKNTTQVGNLLTMVNKIYSAEYSLGPDDKKKTEMYMQSHVNFLNRAINILTILDGLGIGSFAFGPIVISITQYYKTGELYLLLPFRLLYPFNAFDLRVWPFVYLHQIWSAIVAVFTVLGPDSLFYSSCVILNVKFFELKQEIEVIFGDENDGISADRNDVRMKLAHLINRHKHLLRGVEIIESIYAESTLCNILTSSLLICFTGFNVMAYDNILIMTPFIAFLFMVIGQIFLLCYYGDLIQKSSGDLGNGVYNCGWYRRKPAIVKNLMIISARAQKPCKLTAFGFAVINIEAFTKIMSTAWSYFAVLLSFHKTN